MISSPITHQFKDREFWQLHEVQSSTSWTYPTHHHKGFGDLTLLVEGEVTNTINGISTLLESGTISWTREKDLHEMHGRSFRFLNLNIPDERLEVLALALGIGEEFTTLRAQATTPVVQMGSHAGPLEDIWQRIFRIHKGPRADLLVNEFAMKALMALVFPMLPHREHSPTLPDWLERGVQHIELHIEDGVTVSELTNICHKSPEHISRSFKQHLGMSPSAWINQQRITRASLLLSSTNREILDICYSIGFQSPSYFYRVFRKATGLPPKEYRKKHKTMGM